ncbi:tetratricopeptide repeat protein [Streptomyces rubiginosohelvolus]|uniref:tetratricopeptide repeat protein n=1 Tax=Streptomyces sp. CB02130 TaxID=1703934 RepID=UPI000AB3E396|nr:tetratricopeptide repeat protein [Streptomyces sp. CB02130]
MDPVGWPTWAALTSHLTAGLHTAAQHPPLHAILIRAARYLCVSGQSRATRDLTAALHRLWITALGEDHPDTLGIAQYLGHATTDLGTDAAARHIIEDTLERRRRVLGPDHPDTLTSANNLATTLANLRQFRAAEQILGDARARSRRVLGENHPDTQRLTENLAQVLTALGRPFEAHRLRITGGKKGQRRKRR